MVSVIITVWACKCGPAAGPLQTTAVVVARAAWRSDLAARGAVAASSGRRIAGCQAWMKVVCHHGMWRNGQQRAVWWVWRGRRGSAHGGNQSPVPWVQLLQAERRGSS